MNSEGPRENCEIEDQACMMPEQSVCLYMPAFSGNIPLPGLTKAFSSPPCDIYTSNKMLSPFSRCLIETNERNTEIEEIGRRMTCTPEWYHYKGAISIKRKRSGTSRKRRFRRKKKLLSEHLWERRTALRKCESEEPIVDQHDIEPIEEEDNAEFMFSESSSQSESDSDDTVVLDSNVHSPHDDNCLKTCDSCSGSVPDAVQSCSDHKLCRECHEELPDQCVKCLHGPEKIDIKSILKAVETDNDISYFKDIDGNLTYPHIRLCRRRKRLSECSESTFRRRVTILWQVARFLTCEKEGDHKAEQTSNLLLSTWKRQRSSMTPQQLNNTLKRELIDKEEPLIKKDDGFALLTHLSKSRNEAESLRSAVNNLSKVKVFGTRTDLRLFWSHLNLGAEYSSKTVKVREGDFFINVPVTFMTNITSTLEALAERRKDSLNFTKKNDYMLHIRLGIDKGGEDTKVTVSFADSPRSQSCYNQLIVGAYTGPDTYWYLRETMGHTLKEINDIVTLKIGAAVVPVRLFVIADNKALSSIFGHQGASSRFPCNFCVISNQEMRNWNGQEWLDWPNRTDHPDGQTEAYSVPRPALIDVPTDQIVPPMLHGMMGPAAKILNLMYEDALYLDVTLARGEDILEYKLPSSDKVGRKQTKTDIELLSKEASQKYLGMYDRYCERLTQRQGTCTNMPIPDPDPSGCQFTWCYKNLGLRIPTAQSALASPCQRCGVVSHFFCNGIVLSSQLRDTKSTSNYQCLKCEWEECYPEETTFSPLKAIIRKKEDYQRCLDFCKNLEEMRKTDGFVNSLDNKLKEKRIFVQPYHGGTLNGNDVHRFLKEMGQVADFFLSKRFPNEKSNVIAEKLPKKYMKATAPLAQINTLLGKSDLSEDDLAILEEACKKLPHIGQYLPSVAITPKLHILSAHLPQFANRWRDLNNYAEQYVESGHVVWNKIKANFCNGTSKEKLQAVIKNVNIVGVAKYDYLRQK